MHLVTSKNGVRIRLTDERWMHITTGHPDVADYLFEILATIENPDVIYEGNENGLIAAKSFPELSDKFVVIVYLEVSADDGFVITAFVSNKSQEFEKKKVLWKLSS
ncbi:MAG: PBECR2 nuclease fold domain-containing protein [Chitinophagales bacterium]